ELVWRDGFSVVCISSPFNYEFMEHGSTAPLPAYTPVDAHDVHVALTAIDRRLENLHHEQLGPRALMGYSIGAFQALYIAGAESTNRNQLLAFNRYVAIDTPERLLH